MSEREEYINYIKKRKIVLFGAGDYARKFYEDFKDEFSTVLCISNNTEEDMLMIGEEGVLPVYRVTKGLQLAGKDVFIVICAADYKDMEEQLGYSGYVSGKDYIHSDFLRLLVSPQKIVVLYGVCYMRSIYDCLKRSEAFCRDYSAFYWLSYREMNKMEYDFFIFILSVCDLYIYNATISHKERMKNDAFLARLPEECRKISIPIIDSVGYHPQCINSDGDGNPFCVVSIKSGYAPFAQADWNMNRMLSEGRSTSEILEVISDEKFYDKEWLKSNYDRQLRKVQLEEGISDIKISDFLIKEHGRERLFYDGIHISNVVIIELAKRLLRLLGYCEWLPEDELRSARLLYTSEMPVYPSVIQGLGLSVYQGQENRYELYNFQERKKVTFVEYVELYCEFCRDMMYYQKMGLFPE